MQRYEHLYIDGAWRRPQGGRSITVHSPVHEGPIGVIPEAELADADAAVQAARAAAEGWAATPPAERGGFLRRVHARLDSRREEIGHTIAAEVGMPLKLALRIQAGLPIDQLAHCAGLAESFPFSERVGHSLVLREPAGVALCITPWNYPLHQAVAKVAPALAAGCTVVLKPSELAPLTAFLLAEAMEQAGLPPGVFNLVTGPGSGVGEALVRHLEVDLISFTGSTRAGQRVAELAAGGVKRTLLELGGKSAAILLDDADLPAAVRSVVASCMLNSGQTCTALTRLLVPAERHDEVAELAAEAAARFLPGDPFDPATRLGPLISAAQRERVRGRIGTALADGAELVCGGVEPPPGLERGWFLRPTVLGRVRPGSAVEQEELFAPVLATIPYRDEAEALRIANGTPYGLGGAVWSADPQRALAVARRLCAGQVEINGAPFNPFAPFGGRRRSGYGRELGRYGLEEFLAYKSVQFDR